MPRRLTIAPLLLGTFLQRMNSGASTVIYGLLLVQISEHTKHAITSLQVGLLPVVYYIAELTLAPLMGGLSDHFGRRRFLVLGPLIGLLQVVLLIFTPIENALLYLLALQVLIGIASAITTPVVLSYLADFTAIKQNQRMRVMSFYELATSGGIAIGTIAGGIAWDHFGRNAYLLLATLYFVVAVCMYLAPIVNQIFERRTLAVIARHYWSIIRTPGLFIFMPAWICISALVGVWFGSQLTFILSKPSHNKGQVLMGSTSGPGGGHLLSVVLGGIVLYFALCLLFWAFFLNKIPRLRLMLTSIGGVFLACIALLAINHRADDSLLFLWILLLMVGVFAETSFAPAALAYLADISEEAAKDRGLLMGLYSIFLGLGQIIGGGFGGIFAHSFGFDGLIYLTALLACVALPSLLGLAWYERKATHVYIIDAQGT